MNIGRRKANNSKHLQTTLSFPHFHFLVVLTLFYFSTACGMYMYVILKVELIYENALLNSTVYLILFWFLFFSYTIAISENL